LAKASRAVTDLPTDTAVHEAGHVVVAKVLGIAVTDVKVIPGPERTQYAAETHIRWNGASLEDAATVCLAGPVAQQKSFGECDLDSAGPDMEEFERICPAERRDEVIARTVQLIKQHWPAVLTLAAEIDRRGALDSSDLARLGYWWPRISADKSAG